MTNWFHVSADDEQAIVAFMSRVARLPVPSSAADATQLWYKAQLLRRWEAQRQAQLPLDVMQPIEILAGLGAAGVLLYLSAPFLF